MPGPGRHPRRAGENAARLDRRASGRETGVRDAFPKTARLLKRLRRVEELPPADQRAVLKLVDAMLETRRRTAPATSARKRKAS
jgi:hypothetical protein